MSAPSGKIILLSLVFSLALGTAWPITDKFPTEILIPSAWDIPGEISGALHLQFDTHRGFSLGNNSDQSAQWRVRCFFRKDAQPTKLRVHFQGSLTFIEKGLNGILSSTHLDSKDWKEVEIDLTQVSFERGLELVFRFSEKVDGAVNRLRFNGILVPFDQHFQYEESEWKPAEQRPSQFPLGINLEAEYLFLELSSAQRVRLVRQAMRDGFRHIRLHKLYRVYQRVGWEKLYPLLSTFLNYLNQKGISLYLDLLSHPIQGEFAQGWKQSFYLSRRLQEKLDSWIKKLSEIVVGGVSIFRWRGLEYICLINENSLFHEESDQSLKLILEEYTKAVEEKGFHSLDSFKSERMCSVYENFQRKLDSLGFRGLFFLSNYQSGGRDLRVNQKCSSFVDRHFYLDYPSFIKSTARVQNASPIERLEDVVAGFRDLIPDSGGYISEFNLPWPNRFQHEMIPLILYLAKERPILGLWFYDYRLRSTNFHQGGIFGIQKFHSIIGQLPFFRMAMDKGYKVKQRKDGVIEIQGRGFSARSGWIESAGVLLPMTRWVVEGEEEIFSLEKGDGDQFQWAGNFQTHFGKRAMRLDFATPSP